MLGELETPETIVVADLEAGVGTLLRLAEGLSDVVLVVTEPSAKSIQAARRAIEIASGRGSVEIIANRVRDEDDVEVIRAQIDGAVIHVVPDDRAIALADRKGVAPIDDAPDSPGVTAILELADRMRNREKTRQPAT